ncbi:Kinesin light chain [Diplonema papillatum]|nr:Kinesin light chain [Diplonema papillatum]
MLHGMSRAQSTFRTQSEGKRRAFMYPDSLSPPTLEEWMNKLEVGEESSADDDAGDVWIADYLECCKKHPVTRSDRINDWNDDFHAVFAASDKKGGDADDEDRLIDFFDSITETLSPIICKVIPKLMSEESPGPAKLLHPLKKGVNGLPIATLSYRNWVIHLSSNPKLASRVVRTCRAVNRSGIEPVRCPLATAWTYEGYRLLIVAKISLSEAGGLSPEAPLARFIKDSLPCALNVEKVDNLVIRPSGDGYYYVVPGKPVFDDSMRREWTLNVFSGVVTMAGLSQTRQGRADLVVNDFLKSGKQIPDSAKPAWVVTAMRRVGLRVRDLPLLLTAPGEGSKGRQALNAAVITELVVRTIAQIAHAGVADIPAPEANSDEDELDFSIISGGPDQSIVFEKCGEMSLSSRPDENLPMNLQLVNRLYHHVLIEPAGWAELVIPCVLEKYPTVGAAHLDTGSFEREQKQNVLRRLCEMLGTATSNQQVNVTVPVMTSRDYLPNERAAHAATEKQWRAHVSALHQYKQNGFLYAQYAVRRYISQKLAELQENEDTPTQPVDQFLKECLQKAAAAAKTPVGKLSIASLCDSGGQWYVATERPDAALNLLEKGCKARDGVLVHLFEKMASQRGHLKKAGALLEAEGGFDTYFEDLQESLETVAEEMSASVQGGVVEENLVARLMWTVWRMLGKGFVALEEYDDALEHYDSLITSMQATMSFDKENLAVVATEFAQLHLAMKEFDEAERRFQQAVDVYEEAYGFEHPATATAMNNLACLYYNRGNKAKGTTKLGLTLRKQLPEEAVRHFAEARTLLNRIVSISPKILEAASEPGETNLLADALNNLAAVHAGFGNITLALTTYERSLSIAEQVLPADHPIVLTTQKNIKIMLNKRLFKATLLLQTCMRGRLARLLMKRKQRAARVLQRCGRGQMERSRLHFETSNNRHEVFSTEGGQEVKLFTDVEWTWRQAVLPFRKGGVAAFVCGNGSQSVGMAQEVADEVLHEAQSAATGSPLPYLAALAELAASVVFAEHGFFLKMVFLLRAHGIPRTANNSVDRTGAQSALLGAPPSPDVLLSFDPESWTFRGRTLDPKVIEKTWLANYCESSLRRLGGEPQLTAAVLVTDEDEIIIVQEANPLAELGECEAASKQAASAVFSEHQVQVTRVVVLVEESIQKVVVSTSAEVRLHIDAGSALKRKTSIAFLKKESSPGLDEGHRQAILRRNTLYALMAGEYEEETLWTIPITPTGDGMSTAMSPQSNPQSYRSAVNPGFLKTWSDSHPDLTPHTVCFVASSLGAQEASLLPLAGYRTEKDSSYTVFQEVPADSPTPLPELCDHAVADLEAIWGFVPRKVLFVEEGFLSLPEYGSDDGLQAVAADCGDVSNLLSFELPARVLAVLMPQAARLDTFFDMPTVESVWTQDAVAVPLSSPTSPLGTPSASLSLRSPAAQRFRLSPSPAKSKHAVSPSAAKLVGGKHAGGPTPHMKHTLSTGPKLPVDIFGEVAAFAVKGERSGDDRVVVLQELKDGFQAKVGTVAFEEVDVVIDAWQKGRCNVLETMLNARPDRVVFVRQGTVRASINGNRQRDGLRRRLLSGELDGSVLFDFDGLLAKLAADERIRIRGRERRYSAFEIETMWEKAEAGLMGEGDRGLAVFNMSKPAGGKEFLLDNEKSDKTEPNSDANEVVVLQEMPAAAYSDDLSRNIESTIERFEHTHGFMPERVVILSADSMLKTATGRVQRLCNRDAFEEGKFRHQIVAQRKPNPLISIKSTAYEARTIEATLHTALTTRASAFYYPDVMLCLSLGSGNCQIVVVCEIDSKAVLARYLETVERTHAGEESRVVAIDEESDVGSADLREAKGAKRRHHAPRVKGDLDRALEKWCAELVDVFEGEYGVTPDRVVVLEKGSLDRTAADTVSRSKMRRRVQRADYPENTVLVDKVLEGDAQARCLTFEQQLVTVDEVVTLWKTVSREFRENATAALQCDGDLVIIQEVSAEYSIDDAVAGIRLLENAFGVLANVVFVVIGTLKRTANGDVRLLKAREAYVSGSLTEFILFQRKGRDVEVTDLALSCMESSLSRGSPRDKDLPQRRPPGAAPAGGAPAHSTLPRPAAGGNRGRLADVLELSGDQPSQSETSPWGAPPSEAAFSTRKSGDGTLGSPGVAACQQGSSAALFAGDGNSPLQVETRGCLKDAFGESFADDASLPCFECSGCHVDGRYCRWVIRCCRW